VYGDGQNVRDWIHVRDHCAAIERVWRQGRVGEVYNIGGRCERTNLDLTYALLDAMGKPRTMIRYVKDRPGHDRRYAIDCAKLERELGFTASKRIDDGLRGTFDWFVANEPWWRAIMDGSYQGWIDSQYVRNA